MSPRRDPTETGQIEQALDAKRAREKHAAEQLAIPDEIEEEPGTGVVHGEALKRVRRRRTTSQRFEHAEDRLDLLTNELLASRAFVRSVFWKVLAIAGPVVAYLVGKHT